MKVIVTFSGGKDSLAALLWTREHITKNLQSPERIDEIEKLEKEVNATFFGPFSIPKRCFAEGEKYPSIRSVVRCVEWQNATGSLFDDDTATSCMSYYGLCE